MAGECDVPILEIVRILFPSILVVSGWFVVYKLQRGAVAKQDTRKDLRARLDRLDEDLIKLRDKCIEYYTDSDSGFELSTQIKVIGDDIRRQSLILSDQFLKRLKREKMTTCLINVLTTATGGNFESKARVALKSNDLQLNKLFHNSALLITMFEEGFFSSYPPV